MPGPCASAARCSPYAAPAACPSQPATQCRFRAVCSEPFHTSCPKTFHCHLFSTPMSMVPHSNRLVMRGATQAVGRCGSKSAPHSAGSAGPLYTQLCGQSTLLQRSLVAAVQAHGQHATKRGRHSPSCECNQGHAVSRLDILESMQPKQPRSCHSLEHTAQGWTQPRAFQSQGWTWHSPPHSILCQHQLAPSYCWSARPPRTPRQSTVGATLGLHKERNLCICLFNSVLNAWQ